MDTGWAPRLPRLQVSHGGVGVVAAAQDGGGTDWDRLGLHTFQDSDLGSWLGPRWGLMPTPGEQDGGRAWVPEEADVAPDSPARRPNLTSVEARTCSKNIECLLWPEIPPG